MLNSDHHYLTNFPGFDVTQLGFTDELNQARNSVDESFEDPFRSDPEKLFEIEHIDLLARDPVYIHVADNDLVRRAAEGFA
ncbi:Ff.00g018840.m01.CDS01 [Fusarium sp. VM40]|nr:Ff.00g018840.m01.CDS01 [Fusarium sp. VM40]